MSDLELVERFQKGDEAAFNELVHRHKERVYSTARRFMGSHDEADDVVQDVLWKAYQGLRNFRRDANVSTWLYRITVNTALNAIRSKRIREFVRFDDIVGTGESMEGDRPDQVVEDEEQRSLIQKAIEQLPRQQKAVFILRYHEGLSYEEIAAILETSVGGLKANYFHAMRKIEDYVRRAHGT